MGEQREVLDPAVSASYDYVTEQLHTADIKSPFPAWHGWMVRQAFLAGVEWERERAVQKGSES